MLLQISGVSLEFLLRREMLPVRILLSALLSTLGPDPMFSRIVLYTFPPISVLFVLPLGETAEEAVGRV